MDEKRGKIILIVEDEHQIAHLLEKRLSLLGFNVILAYTGETALKLLEKSNPHLILLDVMLPGIDGYTVLKEIRQQELELKKPNPIPVIMQTARGLPTEILCESEGISSYIRKPYDMEELLGAISGALDDLNDEDNGSEYLPKSA